MMLSSPVPALDGAPAGAPAPANSSSAAASAVAAVKSSAKSNKQRMNLYLPPEHQKMFDAVRSELGSLGVDDLSPTSVVKVLYSYVLISIYKFWNVFLCVILEEFHWGQFSFVKFCFPANFEG